MTFEEEKAIMTGHNPPAIDDCIEAWESACERARDAERTIRDRDAEIRGYKHVVDLLRARAGIQTTTPQSETPTPDAPGAGVSVVTRCSRDGEHDPVMRRAGYWKPKATSRGRQSMSRM